MDVVIVGNVEENSLIPPFLVQKDNLPVLFHIIKYWMKYATGKVYVLIPEPYIPICNGYLHYFNTLLSSDNNSSSDSEEDDEELINQEEENECSKKIFFEDIRSWVERSNTKIPLIYEDGNSIPFTAFFSKYLVMNEYKEVPSKKVFFTTTQYFFQETIDLFKTYKRTYKDIEKKIVLFSKDTSLNRGMSIDNIYNLFYTENLENLNRKSFSNENFFFYTFRNQLLTLSNPYINHIPWKVPINQMDIDCIFRDNRFFRKGKTPKGLTLIQKEVKFMSNWKKLDIPQQIQNLFLPVLQIYETAYVYSMPEKYVPFLHYLNLYSTNESDEKNKNIIFEKIMQQLNQIHRLQKKTVESNHWMHDLKIILQDKIQLLEKIITQKSIDKVFSNINNSNSNINNSNSNINNLNKIKINGVTLQSLDEIVEKCKNILTTYYTLLSNFRYVLIHGNLTLSNILINPKDENDFVFTNPTSFFGKNDLFGLKEYDESKVLLSLSGYDSLFHNHFKMGLEKDESQFDLNQVSSEKNVLLEITKPKFDKKITSQYFHSVHYAFVVLHWLHTPLNVENDIEKSIFSYYYGLYLGTLL